MGRGFFLMGETTFSLYNDIQSRTNGEIYIGVVGPVRTGEIYFIKQFMEQMVLPNIKEENVMRRTIDELPQSAQGAHHYDDGAKVCTEGTGGDGIGA